jgi:hypothetical protein
MEDDGAALRARSSAARSGRADQELQSVGARYPLIGGDVKMESSPRHAATRHAETCGSTKVERLLGRPRPNLLRKRRKRRLARLPLGEEQPLREADDAGNAHLVDELREPVLPLAPLSQLYFLRQRRHPQLRRVHPEPLHAHLLPVHDAHADRVVRRKLLPDRISQILEALRHRRAVVISQVQLPRVAGHFAPRKRTPDRMRDARRLVRSQSLGHSHGHVHTASRAGGRARMSRQTRTVLSGHKGVAVAERRPDRDLRVRPRERDQVVLDEFPDATAASAIDAVPQNHLLQLEGAAAGHREAGLGRPGAVPPGVDRPACAHRAQLSGGNSAQQIAFSAVFDVPNSARGGGRRGGGLSGAANRTAPPSIGL